MRAVLKTIVAGCVLVCAAAAGAQAVPQESPVQAQAHSKAWEYGALFQGGKGVTEDRDDFTFFMAGAHVGKVLTSEIGHSFVRGNFEYAGEFFPYWQSNTPTFQRQKCTAVGTTGAITCSLPYTVGGTFHGVSITPIILRWNFTAGHKIMPYIQGAGGVLWTNHKYPAYGQGQVNIINDGPGSDASVWNFTPQGGIGMHYFVKPRRSIDLGANAVHISSASLGDRNPGVNASVQFSIGYSWWK
jgi:lipid A 3-O-deacylase